MSKFKLSEIIGGYETSDGKDFVGKRFFRREITGNVTVNGAKRRKSKINSAANKISHVLSYTNVKTYGLGLLSFGLLTVLIYFAYDFLTLYFSVDIENKTSLTLGVICAIISIPMLVIDGPVSTVAQQYPITDAIFFDFLCMKRMPPSEDEPIHHPTLAVLFGMLLALVGVLASTAYVLGAVLFFLYVYFSLMSPEFSLFATVLLLPYISLDLPEGYGILVSLIVITVISFARKLVFGKRVMNVEQYDMLIAVMLIAILVSGIFNSGTASFTHSIKYLSLSLVYVLTGNIITNRRLADRAVSAVVVSAVPPAVISVITFFAKIGAIGFEEIYYGGISSVYSSREVAAAHFTVSVILALVMAAQSSGYARAGFCALGTASFLGLVLTFDPFAYLSLILGAVACFAFRRGGRSCLTVLPLLLVPYALLLAFGGNIQEWFGACGDGFVLDSIPALWKNVVSTFADNPLVGIGIGSEAFARWLGFTGAQNAHNLFLEVAVEAGVIALLALLAIIGVRMRHRITYRRYLRHSDINLISAASGSAVFALVSLGATVYIWQDLSVFYLFWCVFGIGSATLRIAKQENDDKVLYYQIDRDVDTFDVSVNLERR